MSDLNPLTTVALEKKIIEDDCGNTQKQLHALIMQTTKLASQKQLTSKIRKRDAVEYLRVALKLLIKCNKHLMVKMVDEIKSLLFQVFL